MDEFKRRIYHDPGEIITDMRDLMSRHREIRPLMRGETIDPTFRERLMLTVTEVNGCHYCPYAHAQRALEEGVSEEELKALRKGLSQAETSMMVILPATFVSGIFFPVAAMPPWIQPISYIYPLAYANNAIWRVMLIGSGIGGIIQNLLILALFAVTLYSLGAFLFNHTARG